MNEPKNPQSGPYVNWQVRDFNNLQLKYTGSLTLDCISGLETQADNSAAAIDQLITNIGGAETLRDRGIWQIIIGEEMHISSGAFYFSVQRTLAENTEFLCGKLGLALPDSYKREPERTQVVRAPLADKQTPISAEDLFGPSNPEPLKPHPAGIQRDIRRAARLIIGSIALGVVLGGSALYVRYASRNLDLPPPPLVPIKPSPSPEPAAEEFIDDCRIRFIPETGAYRGACAVTQGENIKPQLRFRKRDRVAAKDAVHQADLLFSRDGKTCQTKEPFDVIPRATQKIQGAVFMCVAPPLK